LLAATAAAVALGRPSDRLGRRPVVIGSIGALIVFGVPMSLAAESGSLRSLALAEIKAGIAIGGALSVSMLAEMFPADVRATGLSMTAGLATALVGGTAPLIDQALYKATGLEVAPAVCVTRGGRSGVRHPVGLAGDGVRGSRLAAHALAGLSEDPSC
jgi:MFS transporter, MHS family, proline/betaine transporter